MSQLRLSEENELLDKQSPLQLDPRMSSRSTSAVHKLHKIKYSRDFKTYAEGGVTYQQHVMLWHFALAHATNSLQTQTLYKKLLRVKNLFMMNAIELTHWVWSLEEQTGSIFKIKYLLFSGFACKQMYSSDTKCIEAKCESIIPNFSEKFRQWAVLTDTNYPLPHSELNRKFKELTSSTIQKRKEPRTHLAPNIRKYSEVSYKSDLSTEEDFERMENDMLNFEIETMKGEKLSPINDFYTLV
mmetsp:Transcript_18471/g.33261  ORF Transcript_18471/g.33261 Transcript_18471/m.33261 type:complete len:242 (+) Transcript_18471:2725-3450(+)